MLFGVIVISKTAATLDFHYIVVLGIPAKDKR